MDSILFWNDISLKAVANDHTGDPKPAGEQGGPTRTSRALAIVHLAMADAYVGVVGVAAGFSSYLGLAGAPGGASFDAAIGEAARVTLQALYPKQSDLFESASETFLPTLAGTPAAITDGVEYGRTVALAMLANRAGDGSDDNTPYFPSSAPGKHRQDPYNPTQGYLSPNWGKVKPFGIGSVTPFLAAPPPAMTTNKYKDDFNEVKKKGVKSGGTRTPAETTIGLYWGYDGAQKLGTPPRLYNQILRLIAASQSNTVAQNARLFALVNMAMADAGIQCWASKYLYNVWRPVVGIREADAGYGPTGLGDGNAATQGDAYWEPLGAPATNPVGGAKNFTPNFPAYPSGHATFGAATFAMVKEVYGTDNIAFKFVSDELNGISRDTDGSIRIVFVGSYKKLSKAIEDNAESRIFLGVHWRFDADAGVKAGTDIAQHIFTHHLHP